MTVAVLCRQCHRDLSGLGAAAAAGRRVCRLIRWLSPASGGCGCPATEEGAGLDTDVGIVISGVGLREQNSIFWDKLLVKLTCVMLPPKSGDQ